MEKALMGGITAIIMVMVMAQVVQAATPQPQYQCPICGAKFMTYDQLYQHFISAHPSEPIDIIWE